MIDRAGFKQKEMSKTHHMGCKELRNHHAIIRIGIQESKHTLQPHTQAKTHPDESYEAAAWLAARQLRAGKECGFVPSAD